MTDERDPKLSQAYRELGREEPPRALDEAILAAAHRAERTHPAPLLSPGVGRPARERWTFPLAAAAVIMLSVGVVMHLQLEQPGIDGLGVAEQKAPPASVPAPAPVAEASKPAPQPETPKPEDRVIARAPAAAKVEAPRPQAAREEVAQTARSEARGAAAGPFVQPPPAVASAPSPAPAPVASAPARESMAMRRSAEAARDRADSAERQVLAAPAAKRAQDAGETPEKWLERIAELRRAGRHEEADKALAEFRQRHPGYRIPDAMLEKVERRDK
ncbi:MAG: hypothetical protein ACT4P9_02485 [Betaproteobacteria bacterium]